MPFQLMVQDRSGENVARGIEQFGRGISRLLEGLAERKERRKKEAQLTDKLRGIADILDEENKDAHKLMGAAQIEGKVEGMFMKSRLAKEKAALEEHAQNKALVAQQIVKMKNDEAQQSRLAQVFQRLGQMGQDQATVPSPLSNETFDAATAPVTPNVIARLIGEAGGGVPSGAFDDIVRAFVPKESGGWRLQPGQVIDYGGRKGMAVSPNSLQLDDAKKDKEELMREPGEGPRVSKDGKFFWDDHTQAWKPISAGNPLNELLRERFGLNDGADAAAPGKGAGSKLPKLRFDPKTLKWSEE